MIKSDKPNPNGGFYVNITSVDMTSAVKGNVPQSVPSQGTQQGSMCSIEENEHRYRTPTEMVATELTCALIEAQGCDNVMDAVEMYKGAVKLLDE